MDKKKILVADDDQGLCLVLKTALETTGLFEVTTVNDGVEALKLIAQSPPDLVFLDFVMPNAGGDKVIAALKKDEKTAKLPIVLMSGLGEMVYLQAKDQWKWMPNNPATKLHGKIPEILQDKSRGSQVAETLGVKDYLHKPFNKDTAVDVAKDILRIGKEPEEAGPTGKAEF